MSKYTTEVRFICENYAGLDESKGYNNVNDIISKSLNQVFDFTWPIYDADYRSVLETKILKHYYTKEIGFETVGLWKLWLDKRLNEIMPYYNQLYRSALLEFNPFYDTDYTTEGNKNGKFDESTTSKSDSKNVRTDDLKEETSGNNKRTDNLTETSNSSTNSNSTSTRTDNLAHYDKTDTDSSAWDMYSDTPQGSLSGVQNNQYLTNARHTTGDVTEINNGTNTGTQSTVSQENATGEGTVKNTGTQTNDTTGVKDNTGTQTNEGNTTGNGTRNYTNVDDYLEHVYGKRGTESYSDMLIKYRKTFMNIDMMIIDELSDLFMNVW